MADITLLDGGNGQEIVRRSGRSPHPLWSLKVMFDTPEVIAQVHGDFIAAGARVLTLNTYTATPVRLARDGFADRFAEAHELAARLAQQAVAASGTPPGRVQVAGCLPPLVASYVAEVALDHAASLADYRKLVAAQAPNVDLFLIETMSNIAEARAALEAAQEAGKPVCLGLTLTDDGAATLRSGERLEAALEVLVPMAPDGIVLNCSIPEAITAAMPTLAGTGLRFGGYANGFTSIAALKPGGTVDGLKARKDLSPEAYGDFAARWVDTGATIIGGCCEVGPAHIAHLAERLATAGHRLTGF